MTPAKWVLETIAGNCEKKIHGKVITIIEGGKITRLQVEQSIKPPIDEPKK